MYSSWNGILIQSFESLEKVLKKKIHLMSLSRSGNIVKSVNVY